MMRKNTKNIEIREVTTVPGTHIGMLVMKDGTRYFKQRSLCRGNGERYPGEAYKQVSVISWQVLNKNPDQICKYARIWYDKSVYIHEDDVRSYILGRQGGIENKLALRTGHYIPYWSIEAAAAIKKMFGIKVYTNGRHESITAPKEIAQAFENNPKLRKLYAADMAIHRGLQLQRTLANYWPDLVHLEEELAAWKASQEEA